MTKPSEKLKYPFDLITLLILASIPRLILLISSQAGIESDEAIVGLMAKHISEGKNIPIFYYGQPYMGSLEAILVAPLFLIFGANNYCLKLIPFLFSLGHVALTYQIGTRLKNVLTGRIAGLYVALAPSSLIIWSLKARGGFIETIFLGSLALLLSLDIFKPQQNKRKIKNSNFIYLGLVLGLGWWTNNQIIFFIAPIGLSLLYLFISSKGYSLRQIGRISLLGTLSFILGGLPFWIYNIQEKPKWQSFELLFGKTAGGSSLRYFSDYWETALPIILGAKKFWSESEIYANSSFAIYSAFLLIIIIGTKNLNKESKTSALPFYVFLITTPLIFSLSSFGWLSRAPRYLLPLYSVLPIILASHLVSIMHTKQLKKWAYCLLGLIITHNLASNYLDGNIADEGQPMVYRAGRVAVDHTELYSWLDANQCNHIHTNYWIGYRAAFETQERITFTRFGTPRSLRLPEYEEPKKTDSNKCGTTYVLVEEEKRGFEKWLNSLGMEYQEAQASGYTILKDVKYKSLKGAKLEVDAVSKVFIPPDNTSLKELSKNTQALFDHSIGSRWGSGGAQKAGMALEIEFNRPAELGSISLLFGQFKHDAPSSLLISAYKEKSSERTFLFDIRGTRAQRDIQHREFGDIKDTWDIRFDKIKVSKLRFELMEENPIFDWSIAELEFYAPPALEETHK